MNRVVELSGPESIVEAVERSQEPQIDLIVIRGLVTGSLMKSLIDGSRQSDAVNTARLYNEVSGLAGADEYVRSRWTAVGYRGYELYDKRTNLGFLDLHRQSGISTHVDSTIKNWLSAIAQISICTSGKRTFLAERLPETFYGEDGGFQFDEFNAFIGFGSSLSQEISAGRVPRSSVEVTEGDAIIFAHHPVINLHAARSGQLGYLTGRHKKLRSSYLQRPGGLGF